MDQFLNYADRGDRFAQAVKKVIAGEWDNTEVLGKTFKFVQNINVVNAGAEHSRRRYGFLCFFNLLSWK